MTNETLKQALECVVNSTEFKIGNPAYEQCESQLRAAIDAEQAKGREAVAFITPLMEQQMFDDWCPYKGNPDPRTVWAAATDAANGLLLCATPPAKPAREWVDMTEQELWLAIDGCANKYEACRVLMKKLREKNAGQPVVKEN